MYHLYSGDLFFTACALFIVAVAVGLFSTRPVLQRVARVTALLAIALAAFATTPLPLIAAIPTTIIALIVTFAIGSEWRHRRVFTVLSIVLVVFCAALELAQIFRSARVPEPEEIVVIGDSLASGGFGEREAWPLVLGREIGARVTNLARPSDEVADALQNQMTEIRPSSVVLVEIGGNDMLGGTSGSDYARDLDRLIAAVRSKAKVVVMIELPVLPGKWRYAAAQRKIADHYGAVMVPKRVLSAVLADPRNTSDGLHLTQRGHDDLARRLALALGW